MRTFLVMLAVVLVASIAGAQESKDTLMLQRALVAERIGRLQAEFEVAKRDLQDIEAKLKAILEKEKAEKPSPSPTPPK